MYLAYLILTACLLLAACLADETAFHSNAKYNNGDFGVYVTQTFASNPDITSVPVLNFMKPFTDCDDGSYLFITPRGNVVDSTPMILDSRGNLIWAATRDYGEVYNLQVQYYKDRPYLTFWGGNDMVAGHGAGQYYMLDQQYNEAFIVKAAHGLDADLHVFHITQDDTALISVYQPIAVDISSELSGRTTGWIWDSIFQELNPETGEAIFEWRASTHISLTKSSAPIGTATEKDAWDAYHINSVEKDDFGNYLISMRYLSAVLYIDGRSGHILWQLGGMDNSFEDLSYGKASTFTGQHDAHWRDGHKYITFFDNGADNYHHGADFSKGATIEIDLENMTAKLVQTFHEAIYSVLSTSQGSYQTLPNGNVLLGYGYNGIVAEFSPDGELLCDAYFQPASTFTTGDVQSYRNLKSNWTGLPALRPDLVLRDEKLFMSWNGATEVVAWLLFGSDGEDGDAEVSSETVRSSSGAVVIEKSGFETTHDLSADDGLRRFVRAIALDGDGQPLGTSDAVDIGDLALPSDTDESDEDDVASHSGDHAYFNGLYLEKDINDATVLFGLGLFASLSMMLVLILAFGRKRVSEASTSYLPEREKVTLVKNQTVDALRWIARQRLSSRRRSIDVSSDDCSIDEGLLEGTRLDRRG